MSTRAERHRQAPESAQTDPDETPEPGYDAHVQAAIEEGRAQIAEGWGVAADEAWKQLGIE